MKQDVRQKYEHTEPCGCYILVVHYTTSNGQFSRMPVYLTTSSDCLLHRGDTDEVLDRCKELCNKVRSMAEQEFFGKS